MRSSSSLEIATLPAVEIYPVPGRMPDMQQPYRRVMRAGGALVKYSGHEQPVSETISLPSPLQERVASFITYYLTDYEPRVDYPPYGNKRYMCHTFAQYLLTGMHAQGGRVINRALELGELGQPVDDDHHFEPGDMGMVADTGSSIPAHSFVSLGGKDVLQVMDMNDNMGCASTDQLLTYYREIGSKDDRNFSLLYINPDVLGRILYATPGLQEAHQI